MDRNNDIIELSAAQLDQVSGAAPGFSLLANVTHIKAQDAGEGKLMGEILSNVAKTRSEISMTFARNSRA